MVEWVELTKSRRGSFRDRHPGGKLLTATQSTSSILPLHHPHLLPTQAPSQRSAHDQEAVQAQAFDILDFARETWQGSGDCDWVLWVTIFEAVRMPCRPGEFSIFMLRIQAVQADGLQKRIRLIFHFRQWRLFYDDEGSYDIIGQQWFGASMMILGLIAQLQHYRLGSQRPTTCPQ